MQSIKCSSESRFSFSFVKKNEIKKEIDLLQVSKPVQYTVIPTKIIKQNSDLASDFILSNLNDCIAQLADVRPIHKKIPRTQKKIIDLSVFYRIFWKFMKSFCLTKISEYFDFFFSKFQCGFRKGYSAQYCLLSKLEKWKSAVDNKKTLGEAFDHLSYGVLLAKLEAYGFSFAALELRQDYLSNSKIYQNTKINSTVSSCEKIFFGFIFQCDLFFIMNKTDFASYADDNTL